MLKSLSDSSPTPSYTTHASTLPREPLTSPTSPTIANCCKSSFPRRAYSRVWGLIEPSWQRLFHHAVSHRILRCRPKFNQFLQTKRRWYPVCAPTTRPTKSGRKNRISPPNMNSLYVTNLPSTKIRKADLRTALYMLFSTYGPVLDVVALRTMSMRGQAHIVYRDVQTATQAMRSLDGQEILGHKLVSAFPSC